jgi:hypothetical protein
MDMQRGSGSNAILSEKMEQLLGLSANQLQVLSVVDQGESVPEEVLRLLEQRQEVIEEINQLWPRFMQQNDESTGEMTQLQRQKILAMLEGIRQNDEQSRKKMEMRLGELGGKVAKSRDSRKAHQAYTMSGPFSGGWFVDKKR